MELRAICEEERAACPFPFYEEGGWFKVYHDGGHYIATRCLRSNVKHTAHSSTREEIDVLFDEVYKSALTADLKGDALTSFLRTELEKEFPDRSDLDEYIEDRVERSRRNLYARKKRFRRKAHLNRWNYFLTFTYDDAKQTEESFRKRLRVCLSHLHTRRGWRYMGVFERAPETGRLHFHGVAYVPEGEMLGKISEVRDYSTSKGRMQTRHENDFFLKRFGKNDFEELNAMEMKHGQTLDYILKYIGKTGERIVYSRGIPTEVYRKLDGSDIITLMRHYGLKFILWDNVLSWEKDIMHYKRRQMTVFDMLCDPYRAA